MTLTIGRTSESYDGETMVEPHPVALNSHSFDSTVFHGTSPVSDLMDELSYRPKND